MTHEVSVLSEMLRVATTDAHKKLWGQYLTTALVARFMANLLAPSSLLHARILDPGAGTGVLGIALADRLFACGVAQVELVAVESEPLARAALGSALASAAQRFGNRFSYSICKDDFLGFAELKQNRPTTAAFDLVIANPPYFKMSPSERRGGDSPNIYTRSIRPVNFPRSWSPVISPFL